MRALLVVDVQNDFCEGGSLAVAGGAEVAAAITDYVRDHGDQYAIIVASKDYHQPDDSNGGHLAVDSEPDFNVSWPSHCVQGTAGADFHSDLSIIALPFEIVMKGQGVPAYSAFEGATVTGTVLDELLLAYEVRTVDVVGIATDYCVRATALDATKRGYDTTVLLDLTAAVHGDSGRSDTAEELARAGVWVLNTDNIDWKVGRDE